MKDQAKAQDALPIEEVERHPMWRNVDQDGDPKHIVALRAAIRRRLTPFDGRQGSQAEAAVVYCKQVFFATALQSSHDDPVWLLGQLAVAQNRAPKHYPAIGSMHEDFVQTVVTNSNIR